MFKLTVKGLNSVVSSALKITIKSVKKIIRTTKLFLAKWVCAVNAAIVKLETFYNFKVITLQLLSWNKISIKFGYVCWIYVPYFESVCKCAPTLLLIFEWIISRKTWRAGKKKQRVEKDFTSQLAGFQICGQILKITFSS